MVLQKAACVWSIFSFCFSVALS